MALQPADLILQLPPRPLEGIVESEMSVRMPLVQARRTPDTDLLSVRERQADVDLVEAAVAMVFARRLHHHPAGGYAPEAILEPGNVLGNNRAQGLARLHSLEVDLDGALHAYCPTDVPFRTLRTRSRNWERASSRWSGSSGIPSRYEAVRLLCRRAASARRSSQASSVPSPRPSQATAT